MGYSDECLGLLGLLMTHRRSQVAISRPEYHITLGLEAGSVVHCVVYKAESVFLYEYMDQRTSHEIA